MKIEQLIPFINFAVFLVSVILHEVSHGFAAKLLGDNTAKEAGRLSFAPFSHLDPLGSMIVPIFLYLTGSPIFGWAKPVPVDVISFNQFGKFFVAAAGIVANLLLAAMGLFMFYATNHLMVPEASIFIQVLCIVVFLFFPINLFLAVFNLLPIPPLDGWMIVTGFLKTNIDSAIMKRPWIMLGGILLAVATIDYISDHLLELVRYLTQRRLN